MSFRRAVFKGKVHLKPPNYSYYLFLFLSPKLVKAFGAVIELGCLDMVGPVTLPLRCTGEGEDTLHTWVEMAFHAGMY